MVLPAEEECVLLGGAILAAASAEQEEVKHALWRDCNVFLRR